MAVVTQSQDTRWVDTPLGQNVVKWGLRLGSFGIFLIIWQWYGSLPTTFAVAPPSEVFTRLWSDVTSGEILQAAFGVNLVTNSFGTVPTMFIGFTIAVVIGVTLGVLIAMWSWGRNTIEPITDALYAAPMSLLIPVIGIWIGLDVRGRVFLVVVWAVFTIIVNTSAGIRETPHDLLEMAQSFRANRWATFWKIIFPSALPYMLVGLRLGMGRAIRGAVTAEILLGVTNLGRYLIGAGSTFNMPKLLAGIVFVIILGLAFIYFAEYVERRVLAWRHH